MEDQSQRYSMSRKEHIVSVRANIFIEKLLELCATHGLILGHEDSQGSFTVELYDQEHEDWIQSAALGEGVGD